MSVKRRSELTSNNVPSIVRAARDGFGLALVMEDQVTEELADGSLVRVLTDWCQPFAGYHLYYASRRQPSTAFQLMVDSLRHRRR